MRFSYAAPAECPDAPAFFAQVRERTTRGREAEPGELARTFHVVVEPDAAGFVGVIEFLDEAGGAVSRRVRGEQCAAVASSLALITALALDATLRETEPAGPAPSVVTPAPRPQPAPRLVVPAVPSRPAPAPRTRAITSMRLGLAGGYAGAEHAPRLGLLGQLDLRGGWALRLLAHYSWDEFVADDQGRRAKLRVNGVETSVCPWRYGGGELAFAPCALFDVGALRVSGVRDDLLTSAQGDTIPWGVVGAELRLSWEPRAPAWAEVRLAGLAPLRQGYRFTFDNPEKTAYEVPAFALSAGLSGGVRFW